jgi:putative flippase GtrA
MTVQFPLIQKQWLRFIIVGAFNTGFSYAVYAVFIFFGANYALANFMGLALGIVVGFNTTGRLVFKNTDNKRFYRFIIVWGVIYLVSTYAIGWFVSIGLNEYAAGLVTLPLSAVMSFVLQKYFVFRRSEID